MHIISFIENPLRDETACWHAALRVLRAEAPKIRIPIAYQPTSLMKGNKGSVAQLLTILRSYLNNSHDSLMISPLGVLQGCREQRFN